MLAIVVNSFTFDVYKNYVIWISIDLNINIFWLTVLIIVILWFFGVGQTLTDDSVTYLIQKRILFCLQ